MTSVGQKLLIFLGECFGLVELISKAGQAGSGMPSQWVLPQTSAT